MSKRYCNEREFQARKNSVYEPAQDVPATVDSWHHGGIGQTQNKKCISVTTPNFNVAHIFFTGQACEP